MSHPFAVKTWLAVLALGLNVALAAAAGPAPLIPRSALFAGTQRYDPQISPDGKYIAYLAPNQGRLNLWLRDLDGSGERPLTKYANYPVRLFKWAYDGHTLIFYRDRGGNEKFHAYAVDLRGGEARDLSPAQAANTGFMLLSPVEAEAGLLWAQVERQHGLYTAPYLYSVDLASGKYTSRGSLPGRFWADNAFKVRLSAGWDPSDVLLSRADEKAPWKTLLSLSPDDQFEDVLGFSPDNQYAYINASWGSDATGLLALDLASGQWRRIAGDPHYDLDTALFDPLSHKLLAFAVLRQRRDWLFMDEATRLDLNRLAALSPGDIRILSQDLSGHFWTVQFEQDNAPPKYYLFDRQSGKATFIFASQPELDPYPLASMQPISFTARDGLKIEGYLSLPVGVKAQGLPLLLVVHGGPRARDRWRFDPEVQWLCNRGYAVLQVNYRASTGYGKKFRNAGTTEWGRKSSSDILDGKLWAIQAGYADPQRVGIYGASYGGYAALAGLAFTPKEYRCGVDICGPSSLVTLFKMDGEEGYSFRGSDRRKSITVDQLAEISPLNSASRIEAPLFIAQGENDPRVPRRESDQIVQSLKDRGKTYDYVLFKDEGHGFRKWENQLSLNERIEAFLAKHLGGRVEAGAFDSTQAADDEKKYAQDLGVNLLAAGQQKNSAFVALGDRYLKGAGVTQSTAVAETWFKKAADKGDVTGMIRLADLHGFGQGGLPVDLPQARQWILKAASTGNRWAQDLAGFDYRSGRFGPRDLALAREWFTKSAQAGFGAAQANLGELWERGLGGPRSLSQALDYYRKGAKKKDVGAMHALARHERRGDGTEGDAADAYALFEKAAGRGDTDADYYLGLMNELGEQRWKSAAAAEKFYERHLSPPGSFHWAKTPAKISQAAEPASLEAAETQLGALPVAAEMDASAPGRALFAPLGPGEKLQAQLRMQWSPSTLYLRWDVAQDSPVLNKQAPGDDLWDADCVELWFSAKSAFSARERKDECPFDYHFIFAPSSASGAPAWDCIQNFDGVRLTATPQADGYRLTAAIPLAGLDGLDWKHGVQVRFETAVAKAGASGRRKTKAYWNAMNDPTSKGGDVPAGHADYWGLAELE
jgi:dipeptidyl aminopeptidase/acylaminoacyl peptidase/TPR repeat protein